MLVLIFNKITKLFYIETMIMLVLIAQNGSFLLLRPLGKLRIIVMLYESIHV